MNRPDVLVLDCIMPKLDGMEVLSALSREGDPDWEDLMYIQLYQ